MEKGDQMDEHHHDDTTSDGVGGVRDDSSRAGFDDFALTTVVTTLRGYFTELSVAPVRGRLPPLVA